MSKYFDAALKSLRTPVCEGRGVKVFRLDEEEKVKLRRNKHRDRKFQRGVTKVTLMKKGTEVVHTGNMGARLKDVEENVDELFYKGAFKEMLGKKLWDDGGPDYEYIMQSSWISDRSKEQVNENEGPKYPDIEVQLTGNDGNAFAILGAVSKAMRRAKVDSKDIDAFMDEATAGDYNHLLQTAMKWVSVG